MPPEPVPPTAAPVLLPPSPLSNEKRLDVLLSHFDKTFELVQAAQAQRNHLFVLLLALLGVELFVTANPGAVLALLLSLVEKFTGTRQRELAGELRFGVVTLFLSAVWLYLLVNYYQRTAYARTYLRYLGRIEQYVGALMGPGLLIREGQFYAENQGRLHAGARLFYDGIFHALMAVILIARVAAEWPQPRSLYGLAVFAAHVVLTATIAWFAAQHLRDLRRSGARNS